MKLLTLNIYDEPFEVMVTGEKDREYRKPTYWIRTRLYNKDGTKKQITHVKIVHGYGKYRPYFIARLHYFKRAEKNYKMAYSNGLKVNISKGDFIIKIGKPIKKGNLKGEFKQLMII